MKRKIIIILVLLLALNISTLSVYADTATGKGINYLGTHLNGATGQITGGSTGDASSWAAIAFSANGIDPSTVKTSTNAPSLIDYLQKNHPLNSSAATEWEKWILAITASGQNPYNFGGINYVSTLESSTYYNGSQIGDATSIPNDWFGVLALISSGVPNSDSILTNSLSFILSHQNSDGGFGYSITAGSDSNDTAAAIQALAEAKNYGVKNTNLENALAKAKTYFLSTQDKTGGFLYDTNPWTTAPDSDSTSWAIMALNVLGMQNSDQANKAKSWITSSPQQSSLDGGFTACNQWDPTTFACTGVGSNSTTTSHALIGLAGKGWIVKIFNANSISVTPATVTPTTIPSPTFTLTPTPAVTQSINSSTPTSTPTITTLPTQAFQKTEGIIVTSTPIHTEPTPIQPRLNRGKSGQTDVPLPSPMPTQVVLGTNTMKKNTSNSSNKQLPFVVAFLGLGVGSLGLYVFKKFKNS